MTTEETKERLSLYLDGELDPAEIEVLRREIEGSTELQAEYDRMLRTTSAVQEFFQDSVHALEKAAGEEVVGRIVEESSAALRLGEAQGHKRAGRPRFLMVVVAVGGIGLLFLAMNSIFSNSPDAGEMLAAAGRELDGRYYELKVESRLPIELSRLTEPLGLLEAVPPELRIWIGPENRYHVLARAPRPGGGDLETHIGCDGERRWTWTKGDPEVKFRRLSAGETSNHAFDGLVKYWRRVVRRVDALIEAPEKLSLLGPVRPPMGKDGDVWWKVRGPPSGGMRSTTFWIDKELHLRRVSIAGIEFDIVERELGPNDFEPEKWVPPGTALRKEEG